MKENKRICNSIRKLKELGICPDCNDTGILKRDIITEHRSICNCGWENKKKKS